LAKGYKVGNFSLRRKLGGGIVEDWRTVIHDTSEEKIFLGLSDDHWDFRTTHGLAKDTGLGEDYVESVLLKYSDLVREALVRDSEGRRLFRLRERGAAPGERAAEARAFIVKSFG
jgi:hypothetical protein